jgi:hypothetical protein
MQGNGFPPYDVIQMLFPGWLTLWSPLFFGVTGFALALLAAWRNQSDSRFWAILGGVILLVSFGRNTVLWDVLYNLPFGFSLFREQERAAFPIALCSSVLVGLGLLALLEKRELPARFERVLRVGLGVMAGSVAIFFLIWQLTNTGDGRLRLMTFSLIVATLTVVLFWWSKRAEPQRILPFAVIGLIALDLFTIGHSVANYDPGAAWQKLSIPAQVRTVQADQDGFYRVDGERGILENYGALYHLQDIRGISPLRLDRYDKLLKLPKAKLWELLAVRYVFTPDQELPAPSKIVGTGADAYGALNIHRLNDPRPLARLVSRTWIEADDQAALNLLGGNDLNLRQTALLSVTPQIELPAALPADANATITQFAPEKIIIQTQSSTAAILDLSVVYDPGWKASIDGQNAAILRSNVALMALALAPGEHTVILTYAPDTYTAGALISLITVIGCAIGGTVWIMRRNGEHHATA